MLRVALSALCIVALAFLLMQFGYAAYKTHERGGQAEVEVVNKIPVALEITCSDDGGLRQLQPVAVASGDKVTLRCGLEKRHDKLRYGLLTMKYKADDQWATLSPRKETKTCTISVDYIEYNEGKMKLTVSNLTDDDNADVTCQ